jgi:hypothetical protein
MSISEASGISPSNQTPLFKAVALYDYTPEEVHASEELTLRRGDKLMVIERDVENSGWSFVRSISSLSSDASDEKVTEETGREGLVPSSYIEVVQDWSDVEWESLMISRSNSFADSLQESERTAHVPLSVVHSKDVNEAYQIAASAPTFEDMQLGPGTQVDGSTSNAKGLQKVYRLYFMLFDNVGSFFFLR